MPQEGAVALNFSWGLARPAKSIRYARKIVDYWLTPILRLDGQSHPNCCVIIVTPALYEEVGRNATIATWYVVVWRNVIVLISVSKLPPILPGLSKSFVLQIEK